MSGRFKSRTEWEVIGGLLLVIAIIVVVGVFVMLAFVEFWLGVRREVRRHKGKLKLWEQ